MQAAVGGGLRTGPVHSGDGVHRSHSMLIEVQEIEEEPCSLLVLAAEPSAGTVLVPRPHRPRLPGQTGAFVAANYPASGNPNLTRIGRRSVLSSASYV